MSKMTSHLGVGKKKTFRKIDVIILIILLVVIIINFYDILRYFSFDVKSPEVSKGAENLFNLIWSYHPDGEYFERPAFNKLSAILAELFGRSLFFGVSINKAVFFITSVGTSVLSFLRYKVKMLKVRNIIFYIAVLAILFFISFVVSDAIYIPWDKAGVHSYWK